jgi:nucleotide-binding universal stress UspA family protein
MGSPPVEILKVAGAEHCNLIAMASQGHRFFGDIFTASTITQVRHHTHIPIFLVCAGKK